MRVLSCCLLVACWPRMALTMAQMQMALNWSIGALEQWSIPCIYDGKMREVGVGTPTHFADTYILAALHLPDPLYGSRVRLNCCFTFAALLQSFCPQFTIFRCGSFERKEIFSFCRAFSSTLLQFPSHIITVYTF